MAQETPNDARYQTFLAAIQQRVCAVCMDQKDDGSCGLQGRVCAIEKHLSGVLQAITAVDSDRMDDYVSAIEAQVCGRCSEQAASGTCALRDKGDCALYVYLSLVVDAIQDVRQAEGRPPLRAEATA